MIVRVTYDTTTIIMIAGSEEDAMNKLEAKDNSYVKLDPHGKWVFKWAEEAIMWSDVHTEEIDGGQDGIIFKVSH